MTLSIIVPPGFEVCSCCEGLGDIVVGTYPSTREEPGGEITKVCEACEGECFFPEEPDEDFDSEEGLDDESDLDYIPDGEDAAFVLASAGFGTDEDYGGASDFDIDDA